MSLPKKGDTVNVCTVFVSVGAIGTVHEFLNAAAASRFIAKEQLTQPNARIWMRCYMALCTAAPE